MLPFAILVGKSVLFGLRLLGRKGSALPGLIVEKLYRPFLDETIGQLPYGFIVVTGTNGKTTTTKVINDLLQAHGLRVLTNKAGSNFVRGIIAATTDKATLTGQLHYDIAVFEQDEAHAVHLVKRIQPRGVVALNVMRDQMDRFGEIDTTAKLIGKVVRSATEWVVLNANDTRIAKLQSEVTAPQTVWFGHGKNLLPKFIGDDQHHHDRLTFFEAATPDVCLEDMQAGQITVQLAGVTHQIHVQLDGSHNAINATAALAVVQTVLPNVQFDRTKDALAAIEPAFGRGERIRLKNGALLRLQLVKNPAGFTHSLRLLEEQDYDAVGIAINDADADGRDVSWLWDVDFTGLQKHQKSVLCGGVRGYDMAVRLKYDGVAADEVVTELNKFIKNMTAKAGQQVIVFTTYTAMLRLRELLKKQGHDVPRVGL
jgi:lipid II isoglutaminyl synthase (glutamine-hydrolysing)